MDDSTWSRWACVDLHLFSSIVCCQIQGLILPGHFGTPHKTTVTVSQDGSPKIVTDVIRYAGHRLYAAVSQKSRRWAKQPGGYETWEAGSILEQVLN